MKLSKKRLLKERDEILALIPAGHTLVGWSSVDDFKTVFEADYIEWGKHHVAVLRECQKLRSTAKRKPKSPV
jgi:hypothetical protein